MSDQNKESSKKDALYLNAQGLASLKSIMESLMLITLATKREMEEREAIDNNAVIVKRMQELEKFAQLSQELWTSFSNNRPVAPQQLLDWSNQANRVADLVDPQNNKKAAHNRIFKIIEANYIQRGLPVPDQVKKDKAATPSMEFTDAEKDLERRLHSIQAHATNIRNNSQPKHRSLWEKFSDACRKIASNTITSFKSLFNRGSKKEIPTVTAVESTEKIRVVPQDFNPAEALKNLKPIPVKPIEKSEEAKRKEQGVDTLLEQMSQLKPISKRESRASSTEIDIDALFNEVIGTTTSPRASVTEQQQAELPRIEVEDAIRKIEPSLRIILARDTNTLLSDNTWNEIKNLVLGAIKGEKEISWPLAEQNIPAVLEEIERQIVGKFRGPQAPKGFYQQNHDVIYDKLENLTKNIEALHSEEPPTAFYKSLNDNEFEAFMAGVEATQPGSPRQSVQLDDNADLADLLRELEGDSPNRTSKRSSQSMQPLLLSHQLKPKEIPRINYNDCKRAIIDAIGASWGHNGNHFKFDTKLRNTIFIAISGELDFNDNPSKRTLSAQDFERLKNEIGAHLERKTNGLGLEGASTMREMVKVMDWLDGQAKKLVAEDNKLEKTLTPPNRPSIQLPSSPVSESPKENVRKAGKPGGGN